MTDDDLTDWQRLPEEARTQAEHITDQIAALITENHCPTCGHRFVVPSLCEDHQAKEHP